MWRRSRLPLPCAAFVTHIAVVVMGLTLSWLVLMQVFSQILSLGRGQIAFEADLNGNAEIYLMDVATGVTTNLTRHRADDRAPTWSPDGRQMAFYADRDGNWNSEIYVMDAYGQNLRRLTDDGKNNWRPVWSPDGQHIVYMQGYDNIIIMDANGSNKHTIARGFSPIWSPDGKSIAYYADEVGLNTDIYIVDIASQAVHNLTNNSANDWGPAWSPDGQHIAFVSSRDGNPEIYLLNVTCQGVNQTCPRETYRLTYNAANDSAPSWSNDRWLAFESQRDGQSQIYIMDEAGHSLWRLTGDATDHRQPSWMP